MRRLDQNELEAGLGGHGDPSEISAVVFRMCRRCILATYTPHVRFGSFATNVFSASPDQCPLFPVSDHLRHQSELTRCANNGLMHRSKQHLYSITSSALASERGRRLAKGRGSARN